MNCRKVQNLISAYVDCELPGVEMLAVRQHLGRCAECNFEYESLLTIKRAFGGMSPKVPAPGLAERIYFRLDQSVETPQEHLLASIRKRLTVFPGRLRFAAATMGAIAMLLTLRSGQIVTTNYAFLPLAQVEQAASLGEANPVQLFPAASRVRSAHLIMPPSPAPNEPWELERGSARAQVSGGGVLTASYTTSP